MTAIKVTPPTAPLPTRPWFRVAFGVFAVAWSGNEFTPLLNLYRQVDGLSATAVFILLGVYVLGIVPALLVGGPASDKYGRRPVLASAPFIAAAGSAVLAFGAHSMALLLIGRILSGIALGLCMAVGTSWIKELSQPPFESGNVPGTGAKRAGLSLTIGFGLGAVIAAALAQWAAHPTLLPFIISGLLGLLAGFWQLPTPETAGPGHSSRVPDRLITALKVPSSAERRFLLVVLPTAAWVFGMCGVAYAVLPALLDDKVSAAPIGFSGLMCLVTLGVGFVTQQFAGRMHRTRSSHGLRVAMALTLLTLAMAVVSAVTVSIWFSVLTAAVAGVAYGSLLQGGLREVQSIARADDLAGLTGVYYSIAYVGFFLPMVLSMVSDWLPYAWSLAVLAVLAVAELVVISVFSGLHPKARFVLARVRRAAGRA
ncbi:MAG: MFS transporter [Galactobacter sp.]